MYRAAPGHVKLFQCEKCSQALFFENSTCVGCGSQLGYAVELQRLLVLPEGLADPRASFGVASGAERYFRCRNYSEHSACNWLVAAPAGGQQPAAEHAPYCRSCELTEVIPDLSDPANLVAWADIERAK